MSPHVRNWQKGFDKAFLDVDASFFERLQGLQDVVFDAGGVAGSIGDAGQALVSKGLEAGHPDALDALFPRGTQARSDLEGIVATARQAPLVFDSMQGAAATRATPEPQPLDLNKMRDSLLQSLSIAGISSAADSALDGLRAMPKALNEPTYEVVTRDPGFEIRMYHNFSAAATRSPFRREPSNEEVVKASSDPFSALFAHGLVGSASEGAMLPMEMRLSFNFTHLKPLSASFVAPPGVSAPSLEASEAQLARKEQIYVQVPERVLAVRSFPGYATAEEAKRQYGMLLSALAVTGIYEPSRDGHFSVMQYNPPHTIPWRRRNEVAVEVTYNAANAARAEARKAARAVAQAAEIEAGTEVGKFTAEMRAQRNAYQGMLSELWKDMDNLKMSTVQVQDYNDLKERLDGQAEIHRENMGELKGTLDAIVVGLADDADAKAELASRVDAHKLEQEHRLETLAKRVEELRLNSVERAAHERIAEELGSHKKAHDSSLAALWTSLEGLQQSLSEGTTQQKALAVKLVSLEAAKAGYDEGLTSMSERVEQQMEELRAGLATGAAETAEQGERLMAQLEAYRSEGMEERDRIWKALDGLRSSIVDGANQQEALIARLEAQSESQTAGFEALEKSVEVLRADLDTSAVHDQLHAEISEQRQQHAELMQSVEELRGNLVELSSSDDRLLAELSVQKESNVEGVSELWKSLEALRESLAAEVSQHEALTAQLEDQKRAHDDGIEALIERVETLRENLANDLNPERFVEDLAAQIKEQQATQASQGADIEQITELAREMRSVIEEKTDQIGTEFEVQSIAHKQDLSDLWNALEALRSNVSEAFEAQDSSGMSEAAAADLWNGVDELRAAVAERSSGHETLAAALDAHKDGQQSALDALARSVDELRANIAETSGNKAVLEELEGQKATHGKHIRHLSNAIEELRSQMKARAAA